MALRAVMCRFTFVYPFGDKKRVVANCSIYTNIPLLKSNLTPQAGAKITLSNPQQSTFLVIH